MARKSKYTDETVAKVVHAIEMGATYELAASYAGIHYDTLREWVNTKPAFSEAIKQAEGKAALVWLTRIQEAASEGDWHAAAWKLERRYPDSYGRTVQTQQQQGQIKHEHSGPAGAPITVRFFDANAAFAAITSGSEADS